MLTRCPSCGTTFRLRPEQLGQAEGRVRCGKCNFAFSAIEHRIDAESADEPLALPTPAENGSFPPLPAAPTHFSALGQRKRFVARAGPASGDGAILGEIETSSSASSDDLLPALDESEREPAERVDEQQLPRDAEAATESLLASPVEADPVAGGDGSVDSREIAQPAAAETVSIETQSEQNPQTATHGAEMAEAPAESAGDDQADDAAAGPAVTSDYLASAATGRPGPWLAGTLLMAVALLLQIGYVYRTELAKNHPGWRPALEAICGRVGCTVELPRDADRVSIESSDLNPESDKKRLQLVATLKNRAEYPQSYPHLELTLTDVRDQPLVRRVFAPSDYLAKDAPPGFGPNAEVAVKLMLEIDDVSASGYRVYLFFP